MGKKKESYTPDELEEDTGFDRRTIAYYVQEDLLPRIGRRGPRTRYPKEYRDRLTLIRKIRDAEEKGDLPYQSLRDIRHFLDQVSPEQIAALADGKLRVEKSILAESGREARLVQRESSARERAGRRGAAMSLPDPDAPDIDTLKLESGDKKKLGVARESLRSPSAADMNEAAALRELRDQPMFSRRREPARAAAAKSVAPPRDEYASLGQRLSMVLTAIEEAGRSHPAETGSSAEVRSRIDVTPNITVSARGLSGENVELMDRLRLLLREYLRLGRRAGSGED
ncbi:MAG: MerR family transcriptional regulator [Gammaproteobacteria bacterium]|nr:MerR family transcriptional regulator [Gammaproteobacteria bacterium]